MTAFRLESEVLEADRRHRLDAVAPKPADSVDLHPASAVSVHLEQPAAETAAAVAVVWAVVAAADQDAFQ